MNSFSLVHFVCTIKHTELSLAVLQNNHSCMFDIELHLLSEHQWHMETNLYNKAFIFC